jgi:hypothetical protein
MKVKDILNKYYKDHIESWTTFGEWNTYNLLWVFYLTTMEWTMLDYKEDDHIKMINPSNTVTLDFIFNPWWVIVSENWKVEIVDNIEKLIWLTYRF